MAPHAQRIEQILVTDGRTPGAAARKPLPSFLRFDSGEISGRIEGEPLGYLVENRQIRAALSKAVIEKEIPVIAPMAAKNLEVTPGAARLICRTAGRSPRRSPSAPRGAARSCARRPASATSAGAMARVASSAR